MHKNTENIWEDFLSIYNLLWSFNTGSQETKEEAEKWIILFLEVYQRKHVTPYMHTLLYHIPKFISLHKSVAPFHNKDLKDLMIVSQKIILEAQTIEIMHYRVK